MAQCLQQARILAEVIKMQNAALDQFSKKLQNAPDVIKLPVFLGSHVNHGFSGVFLRNKWKSS